MNIPSEKLDLIQRIIQLQDEQLLREIKDMLSQPAADWWDQLSQAEKQSIEKGLAQAEQEEGISHAEAMQQIRANRRK
jgi:thiamine pyrophosphate-dependent acetolactate synthase large subunit-like protein